MSKSRKRKKKENRESTIRKYLFFLFCTHFQWEEQEGCGAQTKKYRKGKLRHCIPEIPLSPPSPFQLCNCGVKMRFFGTRKRARELQIDGLSSEEKRRRKQEIDEKSGNPWFRNCYAFSKCGKNTYGGKKYVRVEIWASFTFIYSETFQSGSSFSFCRYGKQRVPNNFLVLFQGGGWDEKKKSSLTSLPEMRARTRFPAKKRFRKIFFLHKKRDSIFESWKLFRLFNFSKKGVVSFSFARGNSDFYIFCFVKNPTQPCRRYPRARNPEHLFHSFLTFENVRIPPFFVTCGNNAHVMCGVTREGGANRLSLPPINSFLFPTPRVEKKSLCVHRFSHKRNLKKWNGIFYSIF